MHKFSLSSCSSNNFSSCLRIYPYKAFCKKPKFDTRMYVSHHIHTTTHGNVLILTGFDNTYPRSPLQIGIRSARGDVIFGCNLKQESLPDLGRMITTTEYVANRIYILTHTVRA